MRSSEVLIVGAGPSGISTSACLKVLSIPHIILEREDCCASLWKKRAYDRLNLHLAKQFCHLPHKPHPPTAPTFISKKGFIKYVDEYVSHFDIKPLYQRTVESADYDEDTRMWRVVAVNAVSYEREEYTARFLVVASGENGEGLIPKVPGLDTFGGEVLHSNQYKSGGKYEGKRVLVVGCGNSGMEIALDLSNYGVNTSIVVRSPFHVLTRNMVYMGMVLLKYLPCSVVDTLMVMLGKMRYGDLSEWGIVRPATGPFLTKVITGRSAVIDVGTIEKIKLGEIQVLPELKSINGDEFTFCNGKIYHFDTVVFATGYKCNAKGWLKEGASLLNDFGLPKASFPDHWKGRTGMYFAGLSRRGLDGVSMDARSIADDIKRVYDEESVSKQPTDAAFHFLKWMKIL